MQLDNVHENFVVIPVCETIQITAGSYYTW